MLSELVTEGRGQGDLFVSGDPRREQLMRAIDRLNGKLGRDTVYFAASGVRRDWAATAGMKSRHFTTDLGQVMEIVLP